jgi:hypothetical protein
MLSAQGPLPMPSALPAAQSGKTRMQSTSKHLQVCCPYTNVISRIQSRCLSYSLPLMQPAEAACCCHTAGSNMCANTCSQPWASAISTASHCCCYCRHCHSQEHQYMPCWMVSCVTQQRTPSVCEYLCPVTAACSTAVTGTPNEHNGRSSTTTTRIACLHSQLLAAKLGLSFEVRSGCF